MNAITLCLLLEHRMFVDALTAWLHRRAPTDIHLVATAAGNTTIQSDLADAAVIIADRPSLTALTPSAVDAAAIVLLLDDIGAEEFDNERVRAYVASADEVDVLPDAIRAAVGSSAASQTPFYSPRVTEVSDAARHRLAEVPENAVILTAKQRRVLNLYVDGLTGQEIAEQLGMARDTVRSYIRNIRRKYRTAGVLVRNKIELLDAAHSPTTFTKPRTLRKKTKPDPAADAKKKERDAAKAIPTLPRSAAPTLPTPTLTVTDISRLFALDENIVRKHLTTGTIPAYRVRNHWLIFTAEVRAISDSPSSRRAGPDILANYGDTMKPRDLEILFRLTRQTINRWLKLGILPASWDGTRWLIHTHQLRHALTTYSNQTPEPPQEDEPKEATPPAAAPSA